MRDLAQMFAHLHGAEVEITEGAGPPPLRAKADMRWSPRNFAF
jgi:hypothetical protein